MDVGVVERAEGVLAVEDVQYTIKRHFDFNSRGERGNPNVTSSDSVRFNDSCSTLSLAL